MSWFCFYLTLAEKYIDFVFHYFQGSEKSSVADSGDNNNGAPNVEAALATSASAAAQIQATRKPTIGQRKPQAKKGGVSFQNMYHVKVNSVQESFAKCFAVHWLKFEIL